LQEGSVCGAFAMVGKLTTKFWDCGYGWGLGFAERLLGVEVTVGVPVLQKGFWAWVAGVTDNSIYPVLFASYLDLAVPGVFYGWRKTLLCIGLSLVLVLPARQPAVVGVYFEFRIFYL
jgi:hypothetical protein